MRNCWFIVRELETYCYPRYYYWLYEWQFHLPRQARLLPEPRDPRGRIHAGAFTLYQMGEAAAPAMKTLARCLEGSNMHFWEYQEVMWSLIGSGPAGAGALPTLRRLAANPKGSMSVQASLAIYTIEGTTNTLRTAILQKFAGGGDLSDFSREIWWFRGDEGVSGVILPIFCNRVRDKATPPAERAELAEHLGELVTTNQLHNQTLEALLASDMSDDVRGAARTAWAEDPGSAANSRSRRCGSACRFASREVKGSLRANLQARYVIGGICLDVTHKGQQRHIWREAHQYTRVVRHAVDGKKLLPLSRDDAGDVFLAAASQAPEARHVYSRVGPRDFPSPSWAAYLALFLFQRLKQISGRRTVRPCTANTIRMYIWVQLLALRFCLLQACRSYGACCICALGCYKHGAPTELKFASNLTFATRR